MYLSGWRRKKWNINIHAHLFHLFLRHPVFTAWPTRKLLWWSCPSKLTGFTVLLYQADEAYSRAPLQHANLQFEYICLINDCCFQDIWTQVYGDHDLDLSGSCDHSLLYRQFPICFFRVFLADRISGRAYGYATVFRPSVCRRLWRYVLWLSGAS